MITTTNKQILSVDFAKKWKDEKEFKKAISRISANTNANYIIAKSKDYALYDKNFGIYLLEANEINELLTPLTSNEQKALDRSMEKTTDRDETYEAELKRLSALPIETKKIRIDSSSRVLAEYALAKCCDFKEDAESEILTYAVRYNEGFGQIKKWLDYFGIEFKEVE